LTPEHWTEGGHPVALERWIERGLVVAAVVLLPLSAALYVQIPPSIDQWQLDYTGWMVVRGHAPYVDIQDGNWPMAHWLHAGSVALWGVDVSAWRWTDCFVLIIGLVGGAPLARRMGGPAGVRWWLLLHPLLYVTSGSWFAGQRDIVAAHLGLLALAMAWRFLEERSHAFAVLAGGALTAAVLVKPTFGLFALVVPLLAWRLERCADLTPAEVIRGVAIVAAWSLGALGLAVLALAAEGSSSTAFWEHAIVSIATRVPSDSVPLGENLQTIGVRVVTSWHWILAGAVGVTVSALRGDDADARTAVGLAWSVVAIGVVSYVAQGHNLEYYLGPVLVGLSLLVAGALGQATRAVGREGVMRFVAAMLMMIAVAGTGSKLRGTFGALVPVLTGAEERASWEARFIAGDDLSLAEARGVGAELATLVPSDGSLLVWGRANVLNLLAERPQPTGFYHPPHFQREFVAEEIFGAWESQFIEELQANPPAAAWVRGVHDFGVTRSSRFLEAWLADHCRPRRALGRGRIFFCAANPVESSDD